MKPADFRQLLIEPGSLLSLIDSQDNEWDYGQRVKGTLKSYVVIERHWPTVNEPQEFWDAGIILSLPTPLHTASGSTKYHGHELLLIHRSPPFHYYPNSPGHKADQPNLPWDDEGQTVLVFGIKSGDSLSAGPIPLKLWRLKTVPLAYEAIMLVENSPNPSDMSRAFQRRHEWQKLKTMLDAGLITPQEHEIKRAEIASRFPFAEEVNQVAHERSHRGAAPISYDKIINAILSSIIHRPWSIVHRPYPRETIN